MKLLYTPEAKEDIEIALAWYERQREHLGFEFLGCIEVAVQSILEKPEMHPNIYSSFKRCLVR